MIKRIILGTVNSYLVPGDGAALLIDTGIRAARRLLLKKIKNEKIGAILLTHGHYDHVDNACYLSQITGAPIYISPKDADLSALNRPGSLKAHTLFGQYLRLLANINFRLDHPDPLGPIRPVYPGNTLSLLGNQIQILDLCGHTDGSLGFLLNQTQLFVGDSMMNFFTPIPAPIYRNREQAQKALETIRRSGAQEIYPGHGRKFSADKIFSAGNKKDFLSG